MGKLFSNLKNYRVAVFVILCLLIGQAYCDMTLPQLTSDIIDTGIQNRGIEHILPEKITKKDYASLNAMMLEDERKILESIYDEAENGTFSLNSEGKEKADKLDEKLIEPVILAYMSSKAESKEFREQMAERFSGMQGDKSVQGSAGLQSGEQSFAGASQMSPEDIRSGLEQMIDKMGDQTVEAMGIAYAAECSERAGMDVDSIQTSYLWACGFRMFLFTLVMFLIAGLVSLISSRVGASIGRDLRSRVFANVMKYSSSEMDKFQTSSLITRATNDIQQVQMASVMILRMLLLAPVMAVWGIIKVYQTKAHMNFVIIASVLIMVAVIGLLMAIALPKIRIMQKLIDKINSVLRENLTGLSVIRAFSREKLSEERFREANKDLRKTQLFVNRTMTFMSPTMMMVMFGSSIAITWVAAHRIDNGTLQVGAMTAFITYAMMIIMSFMVMTAMSVFLPRAGVAAERIDEVLSTKTTIVNKDDAEILTDCKGELVFDNVSFKYPDADDCVLENISFTAKPGETTAIIGSTGCGKSTLIDLIPRFYDVTMGSIRIDGKDIRDYDIKSLRDAIGYVPQKGILFTGNIESNIGFGIKDSEKSDEVVRAAAATAQATNFIEEKEDKYESYVSQGGTNVSGGQRQRLSIARALAKKPSILIFDDSFSALDMKTDANLRRALAHDAKNATKIIVAQRVGTILHAEQIIVLEDGRIVGKGTHDELMKRCDEYIQIARSQLSKKDLGEE